MTKKHDMFAAWRFEMPHTPGPWNWYVRTNGDVYLATPNKGHLIVMDFVRKGMNGAQPRFATWKGEDRENMGGIMVNADKLDIGTHPDAMLIAAAPDLLAEIEFSLACLGDEDEISKEPCWITKMRKRFAALIAKAKGETV